MAHNERFQLRRLAGSGGRLGDGAGVTGPWRCSPSQLQRRHQLVRNHGMSVFHPRDWTRNVTSSQIGQRSPSGRMNRNTIVATTIRSAKKATRTTANTTGFTRSRAVPRYSPARRRENRTAQGSSSCRSMVLQRSTQAIPSSIRSIAISVPLSIGCPSRLSARARCEAPSS
jgi:hypothetical protein